MEYFLLRPNGEQTGTFSLDQVRTMLKTGFIGPETRYWHEGIGEWQPVGRIEESVNFEPLPDSVKTMPPTPLTMSGSLARAIPSPYLKQAVASKAARPPTTKIAVPQSEKKADTPVIPGSMEKPAPLSEPEPGDLDDDEDLPELEEDEEDEDDIPPVEYDRPRESRWMGHFLIAFSLCLIALAIAYAAWVAHKAFDPLGRATFTNKTVFVLSDQGTIKAYMADVQNSSVADTLKQRISETTDPMVLQSLKIALDKESGRHPDEVEQQYVVAGKAQYINPGTYRVIGYFDDDGLFSVPHVGETWVAINYKGAVVYVHKEEEPKP